MNLDKQISWGWKAQCRRLDSATNSIIADLNVGNS